MDCFALRCVADEPQLFGPREVTPATINLEDELRARCQAHGFPAPSMRFHLLAPHGNPYRAAADERDPPAANSTIDDDAIEVRST